MTRLWVAAGAVVVLAGAVLTYVFTSDQPDAPPPAPKPAPMLTPLAFGSEPIWSTEDGQNRIDVRDDVAVYEAEDGMVLLSAADGTVLWRSPVRQADQVSNFALTAVDDRIAVVTDKSEGAVALSIQSGKRVWTSPGRYAVGIAGDVVMAQDQAPDPAGEARGKVSALDLSTGAVVWDLDDRYEGADVVSAGADAVVVRVLAEGKTVGKVLAADLVQGGRIFLSTSDRAWTVDAAGTVVDESLPGPVTAMTDDVVCFTMFDSFAVACHQRNDR
jgi:outer membrane protein assembly factor BamB